MAWNRSQVVRGSSTRINDIDNYHVDPIASDSDRSNQQFYYQPRPGYDYLDQDAIDPMLRDQTQEIDGYPSFMGNAFIQQQQPMERFFQEEQRAFFTTSGPSTLLQGHRASNGMYSNPVGTVPQAMTSQYRMHSPSPSQGLTSTCSSGSPGADFEIYQDDNLRGHLGPSSNFYPISWNAPTQQSFTFAPNSQSSSQSHVHLNQIQNFADVDQQQDAFEGQDEGYDAVSTRDTLSIAPDSYKLGGGHGYNSYPRDEALGASIQDHHSPQGMSSVHNDSASAASPCTEVEGESDANGDEMSITGDPNISESDDGDYHPRSRRKSNRTCRKPTFSIMAPVKSKSTRITKTTKSSSSGSLTCKTCSSIHKDNAGLQRHIAKEHTRAFRCVFDFAGCASNFGSKNEWKRHVASQHTNFSAWVCRIAACGQPSNKSHSAISGHNHNNRNGTGAGGRGGIGAEFNRKDLFTQHVRRMHTPLKVKKATLPNSGFEDYLKNLQVSCLVQKRLPPTRLNCPVSGCAIEFEGNNCWDDRMEHVGKHLENMVAGRGPGGVKIVEQESDGLLVQWALDAQVIERKMGGGYQLFTGYGASENGSSNARAGVLHRSVADNGYMTYGNGHDHGHDGDEDEEDEDEDAEGEVDE